jgi:hypothetical protein
MPIESNGRLLRQHLVMLMEAVQIKHHGSQPFHPTPAHMYHHRINKHVMLLFKSNKYRNLVLQLPPNLRQIFLNPSHVIISLIDSLCLWV